MKKKHHVKKVRKSGWTAKRRKTVQKFRETERKQRERFWANKRSLDCDARFPSASDLGSGVENIVDVIDIKTVAQIDYELEKIEMESYEQAIEVACEIVDKFAPHCRESLNDFIENGGDREATICAIRKRMKNKEQYQNSKRKTTEVTARSGRLPRKRGDATGTSSSK